jgi:hypothetical protein
MDVGREREKNQNPVDVIPIVESIDCLDHTARRRRYRQRNVCVLNAAPFHSSGYCVAIGDRRWRVANEDRGQRRGAARLLDERAR